MQQGHCHSAAACQLAQLPCQPPMISSGEAPLLIMMLLLLLAAATAAGSVCWVLAAAADSRHRCG
jgi:hypothetical protein